jgi:hypothetical protein
VAWYSFSMLCLAIHLWQGWKSAPRNMALQNLIPSDKETVQEVTSLGHMLIVPLCLGFAASPLYAYWLNSQGVTA